MSLKKPIKDYVFVMIQLLLFVAYFLPVLLYNLILPEWLNYSGLVVLGIFILFGITALLQLNSKLSPYPSPIDSSKLITNGAFAISRHPIYTALIFSGFGYAIYISSIYKILITLFLLVLFYFKSEYEEKLLSNKFSEYQDYQKRTRRFI